MVNTANHHVNLIPKLLVIYVYFESISSYSKSSSTKKLRVGDLPGDLVHKDYHAVLLVKHT